MFLQTSSQDEKGEHRGRIMKNKKQRKIINKLWKYYLLYSTIFLIMTWVIFHYFFSNNISFIWKVDGWTQHVKALAYYSDWMQNIAKKIIYEHKLQIPLWDASIGYGSDIISVLHYYAIGDPLNILSIFSPDSKINVCYTLLVLLRIYLAGITFSAYCFYMGKNKYSAVLMGSYIYIFSGYVFLHGMHHPYFINSCIYLPLLLLGVEKILREKKSLLFLITVFLSASSNFYFFYMLVLITVIYVIFRVLALYDIKNIKKAIKAIMHIFVSSIIGVFLSATILLPVILLFLDTDRSKIKRTFNLFYNNEYFLNLLKGFTSAEFIGKHTVLCYASLALISIVILFLKKGHNSLKIGIVLFTAFLCIPFAGHVFNGFSYASNRWVFAYGMLVAFIVVTVLQDIDEINSLALIVSCVVLIFYAIKTNEIGTNGVEKSIQTAILIGMLQIAIIVLFLLVNKFCDINDRYKNACSQIASVMILILVLINIGNNGKVYFGGVIQNVSKEFKTFSETNMGEDAPVDQVIKRVSSNDKDSFWRYSGLYECIERNSTLQSGLKNTSSYWSLTPGNISEFMSEQDMFVNYAYKLRELDGRTFLNELMSVKYFVAFANSNNPNIPYGYQKLNDKGCAKKGYVVYKNNNPLPLGYTYSTYIPQNKYEQMSSIDRQNAMLQGCVVDKKVEGYSKTKVIQNKTKIKYTTTLGDGITKNGNKYNVKKKGASITLKFNGNTNCETYLSINDLKMGQEIKPGKYPMMSVIKISALDEKSNVCKKHFDYMVREHNWYSGRHNFLANLGYGESAKKSITITFKKRGIYSVKDFEIYCQPMNQYNQQVNLLKENILQDVSIKTNKISGNISLNKKKILCLSIPYSKGWTAYVDGKKTEILQANTMLMALPLSEGSHSVVLKYYTPGLKAGIIISLIGLVLCIIVSMCEKKQNKFTT